VNNPVSSKRVFDSSSSEIGNGTEYAAKIEVLRENGTRSLADALARRTDTDEWTSVQATFVIQRFASQQDTSPSGTDVLACIIDTKKGEIEGDYRWHTSQATYISNKGIFRVPPIRAKVPTANRKRDMSVEEMMEQVATFWDPM
jgi:hypothetical protein